MKKFVSIVLALALALSLCTVAFADSKKLDKDDYTIKSMDNTKSEALKDLDGDLYYYAESKTTQTVDGKTTVTITPAYYTFDGAFAVVVDSSCANFKVVKDGKVVDYVYLDRTLVDFDEEDIKNLATSDVVEKTLKSAEVDEGKCGEYEYGEGDETLYVIDGKVYAAADEFEEDVKTALLNGKLVGYVNREIEPEEHEFGLDTLKKLDVTDGTITSAYCIKCEKKIPVVKLDKIAKDDARDYTEILDTGYAYLTDASAAAGTTSTTVDSSKTFDAGVAMYAGLSLMSVAGSAVVIGKKKEF